MASGLARSFCLIHLKVTSTIALTPKPLRQLHSSPCTTASSSSQETRACTGHGSSIPTADEATRMAFPLCGEPPRQFLTSDGETIVCVHPSSPADFSNTKPLHPHKPKMDLLRNMLNPDEIAHVRKLRAEDPDVWSVATLARLFNVKRTVISKAAPADENRREELEKERKLVMQMKPYRRKLYMLEREAKRQKRLQQTLTQSSYPFPNS